MKIQPPSKYFIFFSKFEFRNFYFKLQISVGVKNGKTIMKINGKEAFFQGSFTSSPGGNTYILCSGEKACLCRIKKFFFDCNSSQFFGSFVGYQASFKSSTTPGTNFVVYCKSGSKACYEIKVGIESSLKSSETAVKVVCDDPLSCSTDSVKQIIFQKCPSNTKCFSICTWTSDGVCVC